MVEGPGADAMRGSGFFDGSAAGAGGLGLIEDSMITEGANLFTVGDGGTDV